MKFWQFLGAVVLLLIFGAIITRVVYILRTGHDLDADRAASLRGLLGKGTPAAAAQPGTPEPAPMAPTAGFDPAAALV